VIIFDDRKIANALIEHSEQFTWPKFRLFGFLRRADVGRHQFPQDARSWKVASSDLD
jgi:hypothetical protein